jgi:hypothetical protein
VVLDILVRSVLWQVVEEQSNFIFRFSHRPNSTAPRPCLPNGSALTGANRTAEV